MVRTGLAVGGATLVLIGGAVLSWGGFDSAEARTNRLPAVSAIELRDGVSGNVDIRYRAGATASIRQERDRWWGDWGDRQGNTYRVDDGRLVLDAGDCGWGCDVSYRVTLPRKVPVTGDLGSGSLDVSGMRSVDVDVGSGSVDIADVRGKVRAHTGSGAIELADINGPVDVDTGSGQVEGERVASGEVVASTSSGSISLELSDPRSVRADTGSGQIELTVPHHPYSVTAETGSGSTDVDVTRDSGADRSLRLRTGSGGIDVEQS